MSKTTDQTACRDRLLLVFGRQGCARRRISDIPEGENRLFLSKEELMLSEDVELWITGREGEYRLCGEQLCDRHPFYFETARKEKLLLLLTKELSDIGEAGRMFLGTEEVCQIGSAYRSRIFYECGSLVKPWHGRITLEEGAYFICPENANEGIYVNERALTEKRKLQIGDRVDFYGLHMIVLAPVFVCVAFTGVMRIAGESAEIPQLPGRAEKGRIGSGKNEIVLDGEKLIEREWEREQELHAGEMKLLAPPPQAKMTESPMLLSIGPSLTMVFPMIVMAFAGSRMMGQGSSFYMLSVLTGLCSAALAVFWGISNWGYRRYTTKKAEKQRVMQYREYLQAMKKELTVYRDENRSILEQRYPKAEVFGDKEGMPAKVFWNRYYRQKDFLFLRVGAGSIKFQMDVKMAQKSNDIVPDGLYQEGNRLVEEFKQIGQAPIGIDFFHIRQLGIVLDPGRKESYGVLFQLLMQLAACHCYTEMKVVCFFDKAKPWQMHLADSIRFMPHIWSLDGKTRFLAGDEKESGEVIPVLTAELEKRQENKGISLPWYLVLVLQKELVYGEMLYHCLTDDESGYPVSAVFMEKEKEDLPKSCQAYLVSGEVKELIFRGEEGISRQQVCFEVISGGTARKYFRAIAGFRVRESGMEERIPEKMDFLELYGCHNLSGLKSRQRWKSNHPGKRLKVPVGCGAGGRIVCLDIHERFHGPHGLIAGTTGFGKSELIMTFLLSIAVSFSPEDVNFFMIDYKGGGTGNVLKALPHCAGVISNLSGKQIKRAMSAITSENKRRQQILGKYGVNHIDAYTGLYKEKKAQEALPHLILVVDEFAQLRKEEPEFMQEIISLSQVGRSLGIHLILATQKPAGTVDDRIWSNARFHLCLKVQDKQDSMDMLHNGDAALLSAPGQCYLQIGNHEYYELFQTGYCGEPYREQEEVKRCAALVERTGKRLQISGKEQKAKISQLEAVVDYVNQIAKEEHLRRAGPLWMPELPTQILLEEIKKDDGAEGEMAGMELVLGMCDDPENQRQFSYIYNPLVAGNLAVCGGPLSGKSGLLRLLLWQLFQFFTPKQVVVLYVDIGQGNMRYILDMPGVLGGLWEKEEKDIFFYHLERLFSGRKMWYRNKEDLSIDGGEEEIPKVFLLIDNFAALMQILEEKQQEMLFKLAAEGMGCGIYMAVSAASPGEIPGRLYEKFKTTLALEMSDRYAYGDILRQYHLPVLPQENTRGRGLCKVEGRVLEFQTAFVPEGKEILLQKEELSKEVKTGGKAKGMEGLHLPFPHLPAQPDYQAMAKEHQWDGNNIPIGYSLTTGEIRKLDIAKKTCFLLSHNGGMYRRFLENMAQSLSHQEQKVIWVEPEGCEDYREYEGNCCFLIPDLAGFIRMVNRTDEYRGERIAFWEPLLYGKRKGCFVAGAYHFVTDSLLTVEPLFRALCEPQVGIHLGGNGGSQRVFSFDDLGYARLNQREADGIGYWKQGAFSQTERLLIPGMIKEEE